MTPAGPAQAQADYRFDFVLILEDEGSVRMSPTPAPHVIAAVLTQILFIGMGIHWHFIGGGLPPPQIF